MLKKVSESDPDRRVNYQKTMGQLNKTPNNLFGIYRSRPKGLKFAVDFDVVVNDKTFPFTLERPTDIYIDANETVYVSDLKPSVVIMDKQGNKIARWESPNGHGLWADSRGNIYLADVLGHAIHKYRRRRA